MTKTKILNIKNPVSFEDAIAIHPHVANINIWSIYSKNLHKD